MAAHDPSSPIRGFTLASAKWPLTTVSFFSFWRGQLNLRCFLFASCFFCFVLFFFSSSFSRIRFSATSSNNLQINCATRKWRNTKENRLGNLQGHQDLGRQTVGKPSWIPILCRSACWNKQGGAFLWLVLSGSPAPNPERLDQDTWSGGFWPGPHHSLQF